MALSDQSKREGVSADTNSWNLSIQRIKGTPSSNFAKKNCPDTQKNEGRHYGSTDLFQRDSYQDQFDMKFSRGPNTDASSAAHMNLKRRCMWTTSFQGQMEAAMTLPTSSVFVSNATRTNETMTIRISGAFIRVMQSRIRTACSAT